MKTFAIVAVGIIITFGSISKVSAAESVSLSATVVERKSTDTMNDFILPVVSTRPQVLGASTEKTQNYCPLKEKKTISLWQKITMLFNI